MTRPIPVIGQLDEDELQDWLFHLRKHLPDENFQPLQHLNESDKNQVEIAVVANPDPQDLSQLPNLIWVHSVWAGVEKLIEKFSGSELKLVRLIDPALTDTMSEAVLTWSLFIHRRFLDYQTFQQKKDWQPLPYKSAGEANICILGLGQLGQATAKRLLDNGFNVSGWSRSEKQVEGVSCYSGAQGLKQATSEADIIVGLLPSTQDTFHLMDAKFFANCKTGVSVINFGRGSLISDTDLLKALDSKQVNHAVLDVFHQEPLPNDHVYWGHPRVSILPHISAHTQPVTASKVVAKNIREYRQTGMIPPCVDFNKGY